MPPVTMQQIAKISRVSQPTVSFVLSGRDKELKISAETRQRVLDAARRLGYRRNSAAKAMATGKFGCISLLQSVRRFHSYLPGNLLDGIHDALAERKLSLMMARLSDDKLADASFVPQILQEWSCDGLLIDYINDIPNRLVDLVRQHNLPSIWINSKQAANCVYPDDLAGSYEATRRLLELGHRRIAYVVYVRPLSTQNRHYSEYDRKAGYEKAMREAGLSPRCIGFGEGILRPDAMAYTRRWLAGSDRPTAVLAYNEFEPTVIYAAACSLGLRVPEDLSIVAFSATQAAEAAGVMVSSMEIPQAEVGRAAVGALLERIADPLLQLEPRAIPLRWNQGMTVARFPS